MKIKLMIMLASFNIINIHASYADLKNTSHEKTNDLAVKAFMTNQYHQYMDCIAGTALMAVPKSSPNGNPNRKYHDTLNTCKSKFLEGHTPTVNQPKN
ncbi:MAG: hypothetical protein JO129_04690 [Candidatus Dependentiae bacterium]|nr:hypothetical protein [Candidatus Dependentiae bacterium]